MEGDAGNSRPIHSASRSPGRGHHSCSEEEALLGALLSHFTGSWPPVAFITRPPVPAIETHVCGGGEGMLGVEQCAACTTVHGVRGAGPAQPLSKEFLLLSQTLQ